MSLSSAEGRTDSPVPTISPKEHGITDVAVLEKNYIGAGGSGRNTAIIRSNYLTPEGVRFYDESVKLYEQLSDELNFNVMFQPTGTSDPRPYRWRGQYYAALGGSQPD